MIASSGKMQTISIPGEIVEIFEREGKQLAKIVVKTDQIVDVTTDLQEDTHLGDQVMIEIRFIVERIRPSTVEDLG